MADVEFLEPALVALARIHRKRRHVAPGALVSDDGYPVGATAALAYSPRGRHAGQSDKMNVPNDSEHSGISSFHEIVERSDHNVPASLLAVAEGIFSVARHAEPKLFLGGRRCP